MQFKVLTLGPAAILIQVAGMPPRRKMESRLEIIEVQIVTVGRKTVRPFRFPNSRILPGQ